jgi:hypothetical protein
LILPPSRPVLSDVTLVAVTSVAIAATVDALQKSMAQAEFGRVLLLSDHRPQGRLDGIEWIEIEPLRSRADYSRFMLRGLCPHISTQYALCVQWDGFVINGAAWRSDFAEYDYIGAVWPHFADEHRVGNGGFSLRSRRLLDACQALPFDGEQAEDLVIARLHRARLEKAGIRFAPESVAANFAYERSAPTGREFGFHGAFNLVRHVSPQEALTVFRSLDSSMLAQSERLEVLRWALWRGRFRLARAMMARLG